ncbi:hypothetical protein [Streptomyces sp. NPDC008150]|uniref:hypothetical protein n=1 Tax=Streptomyces sp. NPDC008150 TaxID=3364816 RepID=UPI0036EB7490
MTSPHPVRRRLAAVPAVVAMLAAGLLTAAPAHAAGEALPVVRLAKLPTLALPAAPQTAQPYFSYTTNASTLDVDDAVVTVDFGKLADIATVSFSGNCTVAGTVATCSEWLDYGQVSDGESFGSDTQMTVTALPDAQLGATGSYTVAGHSDEATIVGRTANVVVGGPALALRQPAERTGLAVGSTVAEPVRFTNKGTLPASATEVVLQASPGLDFADHYANCRYGTNGSAQAPTQVAVCRIPGPVGVGESARLATPVRLQVTSAALVTYLDVATYAPRDERYLDGVQLTPGTGKRLRLKVLEEGDTTLPAGDVSVPFTGNASNYRIATLKADNTDDFGVTGATASGGQGADTIFEFTAYSAGPATLFDRSGGEGVPLVRVTPPPGTSVVSTSANCHADAGAYLCRLDSFVVPAGATSHFSLTVHVNDAEPGAQGTVSLVYGPPGEDVYQFPYDKNSANDSAALILQ